MKIAKRLLLPFLLVLLAVLCTGCAGKSRKEVEGVIKNELDLLKNLDSETVRKYLPYTELFPDAAVNTEQAEDINEVFSLFFRDFDYKILDIDVDKEKGTAEASLRLMTLDAHSLACDFAKARLKKEILEEGTSSENTEDNNTSLEYRYLLLNRLLNDRDYETVERSCSVRLTAAPENEEELWEIKRTYSLENDLVGGLMTYLSDPDILSPEDTLTVYLETLKKMDKEEMGSFLGVESILNTEDAPKNEIAHALIEQVHNTFDYTIKESAVKGYQATVSVDITTFDSSSILKAYQRELDTYLASPDAVIDGASRRYQKSYEMLMEHIESNKAVQTVQTDFHLINDGAAWRLKDAGSELGEAIFGSLTTSPVTATEEP